VHCTFSNLKCWSSDSIRKGLVTVIFKFFDNAVDTFRKEKTQRIVPSESGINKCHYLGFVISWIAMYRLIRIGCEIKLCGNETSEPLNWPWKALCSDFSKVVAVEYGLTGVTAVSFFSTFMASLLFHSSVYSWLEPLQRNPERSQCDPNSQGYNPKKLLNERNNIYGKPRLIYWGNAALTSFGLPQDSSLTWRCLPVLHSVGLVAQYH
jgi:hypothetical protein